MQGAILLLLFPGSRLFAARRWRDTPILVKYIGTLYRPPLRQDFLLGVMSLELVLSVYAIYSWVNTTYSRNVTEYDMRVELIIAIFFIFSYFLRVLKCELRPGSVLTPAFLIDVMTVAHIFGFSERKDGWLSLLFLRMYRALDAFEKIEDTGILESFLSEFATAVLTFAKEQRGRNVRRECSAATGIIRPSCLAAQIKRTGN